MGVSIEHGVIVTRQDEGEEEDLRVEIEAQIEKLQGFRNKRVSGYVLKRAPVQVLKFVFDDAPSIKTDEFADILNELLCSGYQVNFTTKQKTIPAMDWAIEEMKVQS